MKVLLIASPYSLSEEEKPKTKVTPMEPPIGLATIAAYLEKNNGTLSFKLGKQK